MLWRMLLWRASKKVSFPARLEVFLPERLAQCRGSCCRCRRKKHSKVMIVRFKSHFLNWPQILLKIRQIYPKGVSVVIKHHHQDQPIMCNRLDTMRNSD